MDRLYNPFFIDGNGNLISKLKQKYGIDSSTRPTDTNVERPQGTHRPSHSDDGLFQRQREGDERVDRLHGAERTDGTPDNQEIGRDTQSDNSAGEQLTDTRLSLKETNEQFNQELQQQIAGTLPNGHIYQLGTPDKVLRSAGIPNLPIELAADRLRDKSTQENHSFQLSDVRNLPQAINSPIAVFESSTHKKDNSKVILTELQSNGNNFVVVMRVRTAQDNSGIEVNDIRSLYPKDSVVGILSWINDGLLQYQDKEKLIDFITQSTHLIGGNETDKEELVNSAAKIVQNFENPKLPNDFDTRFSVSGTQVVPLGEHTLVGLHNITSDKLRKVLKAGGLANPSAAVIDIARQDQIFLYDGLNSASLSYSPDTDRTLSPAARQEMATIRDEAVANGTFMKAPNGEPTRLTERQWLQIRTKAFKKWFSDWNAKHEAEVELPNRLAQWLSKENIEKAQGKSRAEIIKEFGNEPQAIAYIPMQFLPLVDSSTCTSRNHSLGLSGLSACAEHSKVRSYFEM